MTTTPVPFITCVTINLILCSPCGNERLQCPNRHAAGVTPGWIGIWLPARPNAEVILDVLDQVFIDVRPGVSATCARLKPRTAASKITAVDVPMNVAPAIACCPVVRFIGAVSRARWLVGSLALIGLLVV